MNPATRRAILEGLRIAGQAIGAAAQRARSTRPGCIETRQRPDGVWEAVL